VKKVDQLLQVLKELVFPKAFSAKMARIIAALSILALLNNSFQLGLSNTLLVCLEYYDGAVQLLFSWTQPYVLRFAQYLSQLIGLNIAVAEIWRHVFIVMWILFVRDAGVAFADGRRKVGVARSIIGLCIAIVCSMLASTALGGASPFLRNIQLATIPYVGIYVYDLSLYAFSALALRRFWGKDLAAGATTSRWGHFRDNAVRAHIRFALILGCIGLCFILPPISSLSFPGGGLLVLGIATLVNLSYWVVRGIMYAAHVRKTGPEKPDQSRYSLFRESEAGRFALAVGGVLAWLLTFIILSTGAAVFGL